MDIIVKVTPESITHTEVGQMTFDQFSEHVSSMNVGFDTVLDIDTLEITVPEKKTRYKLLIIDC